MNLSKRLRKINQRIFQTVPAGEGSVHTGRRVPERNV